MLPHDPALPNPRRRHTRIPPAVATCVGQPRHQRSSCVLTHLAPPPLLRSSLSSAGASPSPLMSGSCTTCCWFPTSWDSRPFRLRAPGRHHQEKLNFLESKISAYRFELRNMARIIYELKDRLEVEKRNNSFYSPTG
uniref:Uncharacterized protein n=1 Tax=Setaria viridis TaxID=4556 RepID=A0A4U6T345_SETVI|nr:hypothetical protein SEVIR_9G323501v2 [Setaria viridis]